MESTRGTRLNLENDTDGLDINANDPLDNENSSVIGCSTDIGKFLASNYHAPMFINEIMQSIKSDLYRHAGDTMALSLTILMVSILLAIVVISLSQFKDKLGLSNSDIFMVAVLAASVILFFILLLATNLISKFMHTKAEIANIPRWSKSNIKFDN